MGNMSYCRFENTSGDLADCISALEELRNGEGDPLSDRELEKAKELVRQCLDVVAMIQEADIEEGDGLLEMGWNAQDRLIARVLDKMNQDTEKAQAAEDDNEEA